MAERIIINSNILQGKPIIKGTRISVELILELLSSGMSVDEIMQEYPHLQRDDVLAAIDFAAKSLKHEEVFSLQEVHSKPKVAKV